MAASNPRKSSAKNPIQHGFLKSATLAEPERRIFSSGKTDLKAEDDRKGDHKTRSALRMLVASQIMKPMRSPPDLSGWIRDVCRYIRTREVIHNAPDSSKVVAGDAYRWSIASEDHNPQRFTPPLTASISIKALPSEEKIMADKFYEMYNFGDGILSIAFALFDTDRDGYLDSHDVQTFIHVYGLEETSSGTDALISMANGRVAKDQFISWLRSKKINLLSVRYPFKLLRLVSYCFRHDSFRDPFQMSTFMNAIFELTFGEKMLIRGMFGHVGHLNYVDNFGSGSDCPVYYWYWVRRYKRSIRLPAEKLETLVRLWGLTQDDAEIIVDQVRSRFGSDIVSVGYQNFYDIFLSLRERQLTEGPQEVSDLFPLLDIDKDGFLSQTEIGQFADRFNLKLSDHQIDLVTKSFDLDEDGVIGMDDFRQAMLPVLDGTSWEVWLTGVAWAFLLSANPTLLLNLPVAN